MKIDKDIKYGLKLGLLLLQPDKDCYISGVIKKLRFGIVLYMI